MSLLPTGIVTFLFTDIEDFTRIAQRAGSGFQDIVEQHNEILSSAIAASNGVVVDTAGDSFFAVFPSPDDALHAALDAQRRLHEHPWPAGGEIAVRMGAHTGEGRLGGHGYVGVDVIRTARISAAAHGGQLLISGAMRSGLAEAGAAGFRDMGDHRLKGLNAAERIYQVEAPFLGMEFPSLRTQGPPTNLPARDWLFVGRDTEASEVTDLLEGHRLVTLTGAGGIGKTRLAIQIAGQLLDRFDGGVYLVSLAGIDDSEEVVPAIATIIGAPQTGDPIAAVTERIGSAELLLVLDNFEQLIAAGPSVATLVEACPRLRVLLTSQRVLRLREERVYPVSPLELPSDDGLAAVTESESGSLFIQRARSANPSFELTEDHASVIADIVNRLDGLPLAIELAAARSRVLALAALRDQIAASVASLRGGFADAPERHQSVEAAIEWSFGLLDAPGQALFRRASVFAGGFTLESAEAVCSGDPVSNLVDTLATLLDSSLITSGRSDGTVRWRMLEPLRHYGRQRLEESGELDATARSHAQYCADLADAASHSELGADNFLTMAPIRHERRNFTAALGWCAEHEPDLGLSTLMAVAHAFAQTGALAEGRQLANRLLAADGSPAPRLVGLLGAAAMSYWLNDYESAESDYAQAVELARGLGDARRLAEAEYGQAFSLVWLGRVDEAEVISDRAQTAFRELQDEHGQRGVRTLRAFVLWIRGDLDGAEEAFRLITQESRAAGDLGEAMFNELALSGIRIRKNDHVEAARIALDCLTRFVVRRDEGGIVHAIDWLGVAATAIDPEGGLVLGGAGDVLRGRRGGFISLRRLGVPDPREIASASLPSEFVEELWTRGRQLGLDEAVVLAQDWGTGRGLV